MPDTPSPERDPRTVARIKRDATRRLLAIPDVVAVGIGQKVIGDRHTGEPAIKVFVRNKRPLAEVPADEVIPPSIDGVLTDVEIGGEPVAIADPAPVDRPGVFALKAQTQDVKTYRPVVGGARVITKESCTGGTAGCLLWDPANHDVGYVLTSFHVLRTPDITPITKGSTKIGQPTGAESSTRCCNDIIGVFAGGGQSAERDEALVKLDSKTKWQAQIVDIGLVAGSHTLTQADVTVAGSPYKVAKRGERSKVTGGTITALSATTSEADNLIVIKPNPSPNIGNLPPFFAISGDSGSALVNADREVLGLVWGRDDAGNGYAYHIDHVLKRLKDVDGVTVEVAHTTDPNEVHVVPGGSFTEVPPEIAERLAADPAEQRAFTGIGTRAPVGAPWFSDVVPSPRLVETVLDDVRGTEAGRLLLDLWAEHGVEARRLIDTDRRVMLTWHRAGAALTQLMLRLPGDPSRSLPATLNGRPLMECVDRIKAALGRAGSPGLRDALERARAVLPDVAGLTYAEIVAALSTSAARAEELSVDG